MVGNDDDYVAALERAHELHLASGQVPRAVRCAFWIGHSALFRGHAARTTAWFARAQRLLEIHEPNCVECGYLLAPIWLEQIRTGDYDGGFRTAAQAAEIGESFGDSDLVWLARDEQARALAKQGRLRDALALVDEVLVAAVRGELSPIVTGIVYCNTIAFCRDAYELRHAREWTETLTQWCERQPEMVAHNGLCLVHRAEIMEMQGRLGRGAGRGTAGSRALYARRPQRAGMRRRALPAGRDTSPAGRARGCGGGVQTGKQVRIRAAARSSASALGRGQSVGGYRRHPPHRR